jgi:hypothetical protein
MAAGALLEDLQALTPDRTPNLVAVFCSAGGALAATEAACRLINTPDRIYWRDRFEAVFLF